MFSGKYIARNQKLIKEIVDFYGHGFFFSKKILDLGCGYADISCVLHRLGSDITAVDARQDHLKMVQKKYPGIKTVKADLDWSFPFVGKAFDLALDLDLICHLNNYEKHLKEICHNCTNVIIETAVCDSNDPHKCIIVPENKNIYDLSFNGSGCFASPAAIERVLTECGMSFERVDQAKYNSGSYIYDWSPNNNDECNINKRRIWFASKSANSQKIIKTEPIFPAINRELLTVQNKPPAPIINNTFVKPLEINDNRNNRIAISISGHLRSFERTAGHFFNNIIGSNRSKCDIFIHTWETLGCKALPYDKPLHNVMTSSKLKQINAIYNPKIITINNHQEYKNLFLEKDSQAKLSGADRAGLRNGGLADYSSMLYSWKQTHDMICKFEEENNFKYDLIIKVRPDILFNKKFDINRATNRLCVPNMGQFYQNAMNDQFAVGENKSMKLYLSLYDNLLSYFHNRVVPMLRPEFLLKYHLKKHGIMAFEEDISYYVLRANNDVMHPITVKQIGW